MNYLVPVQIGAPDKFSNYLRLFNTMLSFRRLFSVVQSPQRLRAYLAGLWKLHLPFPSPFYPDYVWVKIKLRGA